MVSVIVPIYNSQDYLARCVDSILSQSFENIEIILVNDGSTDETPIICEHYSQIDSRVKVFNQDNKGQSSARRTGLLNSKGEYITFVDSDDYLEEDAIEKLIVCQKSNSVDCVIAQIKKIYPNGRVTYNPSYFEGVFEGRKLACRIMNLDVFYELQLFPAVYGALFKRTEIIAAFNKVDDKIRYAEDYAIFSLLLLNASRVFVLNEYIYNYFQHDNSLTHKKDRKEVLESQIALWKNMNRQLCIANAPKEMYKQLEWIVIRNLLMLDQTIFMKYSFLFPFTCIASGSKIVVYGAGYVGNSLVNAINKSDKYELIAWIDKKWSEYGAEVQCITCIEGLEYDYIYIAILNYTASNEVKKELLERGVNINKICCINDGMLDLSVLREFRL